MEVKEGIEHIRLVDVNGRPEAPGRARGAIQLQCAAYRFGCVAQRAALLMPWHHPWLRWIGPQGHTRWEAGHVRSIHERREYRVSDRAIALPPLATREAVGRQPLRRVFGWRVRPEQTSLPCSLRLQHWLCSSGSAEGGRAWELYHERVTSMARQERTAEHCMAPRPSHALTCGLKGCAGYASIDANADEGGSLVYAARSRQGHLGHADCRGQGELEGCGRVGVGRAPRLVGCGSPFDPYGTKRSVHVPSDALLHWAQRHLAIAWRGGRDPEQRLAHPRRHSARVRMAH